MAAYMIVDLSLEQGRARDAFSALKNGFRDCFDGDWISPSCDQWAVQTCFAAILRELGQGEKAATLEPEVWKSLKSLWGGDGVPVGSAGWRLSATWTGGIADVAVLAAFGHREQALATLEQAVEQGWRGWRESWKYKQRFEAPLSSIRDDPRFKAAFARIEADMNEQLKIVREMERKGEIPSRGDLPQPRLDP